MTAPEIQLETEAKLDAPVGAALPDLRSLPGVAAVHESTVDLEATYFDTADLRLAAAGITLRRRAGGGDEGWHLKLPAGELERYEVRRRLTSAARPPRGLSDLVVSRTRGSALAPVAMINTRRHVLELTGPDGVALAEVADDTVTARVDGDETVWRELEVELRGGGDAALLEMITARLEAAGAAPAAAASKLARALGVAAREPARLDARSRGHEVVGAYVAEQVEALLAAEPRARLDLPDAVHKMRVAARRLRSALATFRPLLDGDVTEPLRADLQRLGVLLGGPRDAEVMRERLLDAVAELDRALVLGPVRRRIGTTLGRRHRETHRRFVDGLGSEWYAALVGDLVRLAEAPPFTGRAHRRAAKALPLLVRQATRRVGRAARAAAASAEADGPAYDELLHEVRKAAKRARYAGEAVAPALGDEWAELAAAYEEVQEVLGEHQDSIVTRSLLRDLGVQAQLAGENGFTFGLLYGLEVARGERTEATYAAAYEAAYALDRRLH